MCGRFALDCSGSPAVSHGGGGGFNPFSWAWHGIVRGAKWVYNNRGTIASVVAAGVCLSGVGTAACGAALALAYVVRAQQRIQTYGFKRSLDANVADGVMTTFFMIPMAGATITGGEALTGASSVILNTVATIPDAVQFVGGFLPGHDPVFFNGSTLNFGG
jgi:hypothetical protein